MPRAIMTCGWAADDDESWQRLDLTSRDVVAVERRFPGLTAQQLFNEVSFDNLYKAVWLTLRNRGAIPKEVGLQLFMDTHVITANESMVPSLDGDGGGDLADTDPDGEGEGAGNPTDQDR